jgi:2-acylglycerol O-acyltransferase 2
MTLELNFRLPLMREFLLSVGVADASQEACFRILGRGAGSAIMLAVGGAQESLLTARGRMDLVRGWWSLALVFARVGIGWVGGVFFKGA